MSRYLVVTHQTALSPDLQRRVQALVAEDPAAEFAVLVPESPGLTFTWEGETVDVARQRAEAAKTLLEETVRARVFRTAVGVPEPLQAITDELLAHPGYDALVICTLPALVAREPVPAFRSSSLSMPQTTPKRLGMAEQNDLDTS